MTLSDTLPKAEAVAVEDYNAMALECGLPTVRIMTPKRIKQLRGRLKDGNGLPGWRYALDKVRASPFLRGRNDRGWRADFDFLLQQSSFVKLIEGRYDTQGRADPLAAAASQFVGGAARGGQRGLDVQAELGFGGGAE